MGLDTNKRWALMCRPVIGGAWVIGPDVRKILAAALEDAAAHRSGQGDCDECPGQADLDMIAAMGIAAPDKCDAHMLDDEMAAAYAMVLRWFGPLDPGDALPATLARGLEAEDLDAPR
jgi:hypothetical protein